MAPKSEKLITVTELCSRLVLPNAPRPLSERNVRKYFEQLGIKPRLQKPEGYPYDVNHITEEQALLIERLFQEKHWRKFKAAEAKVSK